MQTRTVKDTRSKGKVSVWVTFQPFPTVGACAAIPTYRRVVSSSRLCDRAVIAYQFQVFQIRHFVICKDIMKSKLSYLEAIQALPGDTASAKFRWIAQFITERVRAGEDLKTILESEKVPHALLPLIKAEAAKILKDHEVLAESLKSEDALVINRALQATWFFDGSRKDVLTIEYFLDKLFPTVTLSTRGRIVKALGKNLVRKEQSFAEEFFLVMSEKYGNSQAIPLLIACRTDFTYNIVVERQIILPKRILKTIFRREPDFVVRYLRLTKPTSAKERTNRQYEIYNNASFLSRLVKKNLDVFVELFEMHEASPPYFKLSMKCGENFLKNGKDYLMRKPRLYIHIVPLKLIDDKRMELLFPKLLPDEQKDFNIETMLGYLKYYPEDQKGILLLKSYKDKYGKDYFENLNNVQPIVLKLLPRDERIKQARRKIEKIGGPHEPYDYSAYERCWWCYLPIEESIPAIKEKISRTSQGDDRLYLLEQLLFSCQVNKDDDALVETLNYINTRHKNETSWVIETVLQTIETLFDLTKLNAKHWAILYEMIRRAYVKRDIPLTKDTFVKLLEGALYFRLTHDQPIDQVIDMLAESKATRQTGNWNVLIKYPEYERKILEACLAVVEKKFETEIYGKTNEEKIGILLDLVVSIYDFNERHVKPNNRIERLSLKNYQWLLNKISASIKEYPREHIINDIKLQIGNNEMEIYKSLVGHDRIIVDVCNGKALILLRKDPQSILMHWEQYLKRCQEYYSGHVYQFLRHVRWYKDIPIKFAEECLKQVKEDKKEGAIFVLAILLDGQSYAELIEPFLPSKLTVEIEGDEAKSDYVFVYSIVSGIKVANPPVPLELIGRLCEGDYLGKALEAIVNVNNRTSLSKVVPFIMKLSNDRVSVRKHGIRLFGIVSSLKEISEFLLEKWRKEEHHSIREVLFTTILDQLYENPGPTTWSLFKEAVSNFTIKDRFCLSIRFKFAKISDEYLVDFIKELLKIYDKFTKFGVTQYETESLICHVLAELNIAITCLLPEEFCEELLNRFLCHDSNSIAKYTAMFLIDSYISIIVKEKLDSRLAIVNKILRQQVELRWDVKDSNNTYHYPYNHSIRQLFDKVVCVLTYEKENLEAERLLIDGFLKIFLNILSPHKDPESFLKLTFAKERLESEDAKQFGSRIARKLIELIEIFTPDMILYVAITLRNFIRQNGKAFPAFEEAVLDIIEILINTNNYHCLFAAANVMVTKWPRNDIKRYEFIVEKLRERNDPAITSILYTRINNSTA